MNNIRIEKVVNPSEEILDLTTKWMFNWWGTEENHSYDEVKIYMKNSFNSDRLPQTYIMYLENKVIGMYQITYNDLFIRPDIYPWIANLYIDENYRNKGYGRILIDSIKDQIKRNTPFEKVFLYTIHNNLYEKFGWKYINILDNKGSRLYELNLK